MSKGQAINSFSGGLVSDLNAITTPNNVVVYCLNGTFLTMNGNELVLQNDMGNADLNDGENKVQLSQGFVPIGVKEHGGIIYIISKNPTNLEIEIGSFPSQRVLTPNTQSSTGILSQYYPSIVYPYYGNTINIINKTINVGDPFLISLPLNISELALLTDNITRRFYIPKLILKTNSTEIDITDDVKNYIQKINTVNDTFSTTVLVDNGSGGTTSIINNFWFLPTNLTGNFNTYVTNKKCLFFTNRQSGTIGIRFDLERVDSFKLIPDQYGNSFPQVETLYNNSGDIISNTVKFLSFSVSQPSSIKVNSINLKWSLTADDASPIPNESLSGEIEYAVEELTTSELTKFGGGNFLEIPLGLTKNRTITYTILPKNTTYGIDFSELSVVQTLDLSKSSLEVGLGIKYNTISPSINQYINPYAPNLGDQINFLYYSGNDIVYSPTYGPFPQVINWGYGPGWRINSLNKFKNLKYITKYNNLVFNSIAGDNVKVKHTLAVVGSDNIDTIRAVTRFKLKSNSIESYIPNSEKNDYLTVADSDQKILEHFFDTSFSLDTTKENQIIVESSNWFNREGQDGTREETTLYGNNAGRLFNNELEYNLFPIIGKYSKTNEPLSKDNEIVDTNIKTNLILTGDFKGTPSDNWDYYIDDVSSSLVISSTNTSFEQKYATLGLGSNIYKLVSKNTITITEEGKYILSLLIKYRNSTGSVLPKLIKNGTEVTINSPIVLSSSWTRESYVLDLAINDTVKILFETLQSGGGYCDITNITLTKKLDQATNTEPVQAVLVYNEDITLLTDKDNNSIKRLVGEYLPNPAYYEKIDIFNLNNDFVTNIPKVVAGVKLNALVVRQ